MLYVHAALDVFRCWLKITALTKINFLLESLKTLKKIFLLPKCYCDPFGKLSNCVKGPEIGAMTQGLSPLASRAGDGKETFQFQYCKKVSYPLGGLPTTDSKMFPWVRLDHGLLSSSHQKYDFQRLQKIIHVNIPKNMSCQQTRLLIQKT